MISDKQKTIYAFPYSNYDALICSGAIRSGKSSHMTVAFIDDAMRRYNGKRFAICGKTVKSAIENIIAPYVAMSYAKKKYKLHFSRSTNLLTVTRGRKTNVFEVFGGKDEASYTLIQGRTLAGVLLDEVALMPQSFINQATARCSVDGSKLWFNCNPDSPRHWFYLEWILGCKDKNALVLEFVLRDNPSLTDHIIKRYKSMYHGVFYDRYILGKWVIAEGLVYQFESESEYTCTYDEALGKGTEGEWYISIDYGITNPFVAELWRVTPDCAYMVEEYYFDSRKEMRKKTDSEHYFALEKLASNRLIQNIIIDPSASSFKEEIWRHDRFDVLDANNSVIDGIAVTNQMLSSGKIKIADTCTNTIGEMALYRWDDKKSHDAVIKEYDHAMDAMRYMAYTTLRFELEGFA